MRRLNHKVSTRCALHACYMRLLTLCVRQPRPCPELHLHPALESPCACVLQVDMGYNTLLNFLGTAVQL